MLCFCLPGFTANENITAEMDIMIGEFYDLDAIIDCPKEGAKSMVATLALRIEKEVVRSF